MRRLYAPSLLGPVRAGRGGTLIVLIGISIVSASGGPVDLGASP